MHNYELFFFDLDGTITESKSNVDDEMANIISQLLKHKKVVIISGARFSQFKEQFIDFLPNGTNLENLYIAPLTGGSFYSFKDDNWVKVYEDALSPEERLKITSILKRAIKDNDFLTPEKIYGDQIEDRGGQITFSALGQKSPVEEKKLWDPSIEKRKALKKILDKDLSEFEVSVGGSTSVDIRKKGIDKAYGINKIASLLSIPKEKIIFFGDAIFEGGNDYSATTTGVAIQKVSGPEETKSFLKEYLKKN
ncbi:TPA: HAD family hydrolase [Candidatus Campbellbacteria bacterium]|jgi:HAD superfamily hydrolase (TIGR01484 family)|nr:MAG: HAD family hydrolase [Candidatus Campbellbacteria bacterium GW2011_OD1_34_28]KKP75254.1 MAG: HAD-superfamily hydrolase, subfamily IIB [Candidatus Campbellbacteria bacterium GW2011_GWD2_35_24]KKP76185.1 MAG: HAD-superfamily hydrolase [Candidatus Campbellbacteria bacterium GW2011_GWC2_35_28]KKP77374.1 MAG: HAD-superfamily hydrolase, subfamily IIB [Candidatus Campbellbacteria bacterium GW2011_GWC1_35_31]KKP79303.1 MAG: HAD-superfamily hydrolase, subfamily IIB [Candidatus Campbellbacteria b